MKININKWVLGTGVVSLICISLAFTQPNERFFEIAKNMEILSSVYSEVNRYYVDEVNPSELMQVGIEAMLESLDPYTNYIPEEAIEDYRFISTGQYGGVGSIIGTRENKILILMPYPDFPAYKAGLRIGDEIVEINNQVVKGKNTDDISDLLKGQPGTKVELKIRRYGQQQLLNMEIVREKITVKNVPYSGMVSEKVGYVKLTNFTNEAAKEVHKSFLALKEQGAEYFILDLRDNTGGLLKEAIDISNLFIPRGKEIVKTKGKVEKWNETHIASEQPFDLNTPLAVLVNGSSASASEIVSGVIQDYDRGILVGSRTYGKGLVQATMPTAFNTQIKVTTAKYYIPSGRCIQAIDYSKRDKEGNVIKTPDSLFVAFKTANGRVVYDGGGINPDVIPSKKTAMLPVIRALTVKNMLFDYATKYYFEHPTIASAREFKLTDQEYDAFLAWLDEQKFDYQLAVEKNIDEIEKQTASDSLSMNVSTEIKQLRDKIRSGKKNELITQKNEIKHVLQMEIASRYYLQNGIIESGFNKDIDLDEAIRILKNTAEYNRILAMKKQ